MATYRLETINGSSLTGTSGNTGRTYTIQYNNLIAGSMTIHVQGGWLGSTDFSYTSAGVVTFNVAVFDSDEVVIEYLTTAYIGSTDAGLKYATVLQLCVACNLYKTVPAREPGTTPTREQITSGAVSNGTVAYLDYANIISGSYTLYTGGTTSATATTALTEGTHYTLDLTTGAVTFTTAGATLIASNYVFAQYSYIEIDRSDDYLTELLLQAEKEVDNMLNTTFTNGLATNPEYPSVVEYQSSKGMFNRDYFLKKRPVIDVTSTLASSLTSTATSCVLTAGGGEDLPQSGTIIIGTEAITYTSISTNTLNGLTRGAYDTTAAAHDAGDETHTTLIQTSGSGEGLSPTWETQEFHTDATLDPETGKIYIYQDSYIQSTYLATRIHPRQDVPRRFRAVYLYGWDTIPKDITRLTILFAKRMLVQDNISASMIMGRNEFQPEMFNADEREIQRITDSYRQLSIENT